MPVHRSLYYHKDDRVNEVAPSRSGGVLTANINRTVASKGDSRLNFELSQTAMSARLSSLLISIGGEFAHSSSFFVNSAAAMFKFWGEDDDGKLS
jgi:hypothetical protein